MKTSRFTVILRKEDDMYMAECPEVGTVDQGETIEPAILWFPVSGWESLLEALPPPR